MSLAAQPDEPGNEVAVIIDRICDEVSQTPRIRRAFGDTSNLDVYDAVYGFRRARTELVRHVLKRNMKTEYDDPETILVVHSHGDERAKQLFAEALSAQNIMLSKCEAAGFRFIESREIPS